MHTLVPSFAKVVKHRPYHLDKKFMQVFGSQGTRSDKHLEQFRDVAAELAMFDGFRFITLFKFLKDTLIGCNEGYVSESMALVIFGRLV